MARPQKCGMDYFPHDTDALSDEKIEALRMLYGNDGYAFYFILLERIYRTEQFELDVSDAETIQILSRKIGVSEERFNKMLCTALKRNCFDNEIYNNRKCLTSAGIKKRADVVISKRISSKKAYETKISVAETIQETTPESTQRKGKERKENKENISLADVDLIWNMYPRKEGKKVACKKIPKILKEIGVESLKQCIESYERKIRVEKIEKKFIMQGSTFFNGRYEDFINTTEQPQQERKKVEMVRREII